MKKRVDVSVIIVTYNTKELSLSCLKSLERSLQGNLTRETIVVDNASTDGTSEAIRKEFPGVIVTRNKTNLGFGAANNIGIRRSHGKYILLLNSDTVVERNSIFSMITFMEEHPKAGAATCKLLLPNGSMDPACHRGFPTPWNAFCYYAKLEKIFPKIKLFAGYHQGYRDMAVPHEVDAISGAFFLTKKDVIDEVGMLDENFFMYAEDIDWAYRMKEKGWQIWFNPTVSILHKKKQSGRSHALKNMRLKAQEHFLLNNKYFYTKHYVQKYPWIITRCVYAFYDVQLFLLRTFG